MTLLISAIMIITPAVAEARGCKATRNDTAVLYGECSTEKGITIFRSCAGFYCRLPIGKEEALSGKEKVCKIKEDIIANAKKEHNLLDIKDIPLCKSM